MFGVRHAARFVGVTWKEINFPLKVRERVNAEW